MVLFLLACGGEPVVASVAAEAPVAIDSPFCPSFEACMEGLPGWGPSCDRWSAGDPDCAAADWTASPSEKLDELKRGIAALRSPGRAAEAAAETWKAADVPTTKAADVPATKGK